MVKWQRLIELVAIALVVAAARLWFQGRLSINRPDIRPRVHRVSDSETLVSPGESAGRVSDVINATTRHTPDGTATTHSPRIVLASIPRTGNGWLRGLMEATTGVATVSVFPEGEAVYDDLTQAYGWCMHALCQLGQPHAQQHLRGR